MKQNLKSRAKTGKNQNDNKGITLIALVITIIIMLILAGVAISMATNSNGLFGKANEAGDRWNNAVGKEQSTVQDLLDILEVEPPVPEGWDSEKIAGLKRETSIIANTEKTRIVPIPVGYTLSEIPTEKTIAGGLVIYEIPEGATVDWTNKTITIDEETSNLQETVNQYVWIPVDDINYMVMCKNNGSAIKADGETATINDATTCNLVLQEVEIEGETTYILKCVTHDSTDLCGRLYATDSATTDSTIPKSYNSSMQFTDEERVAQVWDEINYREPDIVSEYDKDDSGSTTYMAMAGITSGKVEDFQKQLIDDFKAMATSVAKYGGFYVSRYEAGANGASKKNQQVLVAGNNTLTGYDLSTCITGNKWYGIYNTLRNKTEVDTNVVSTHMIWGSQYDQIINFLETNPDNEPQIGHTNRQLEVQVKTGTNEADVMNNIYDLEGNNIEWTALAYSTDTRTYRGASFNYAAEAKYFYPASYRGNFSSARIYCNVASRTMLYIN